MIWAGFIFGIVGSFHCVGMCGPIAMALPFVGSSGWRYYAGRLLYNSGRIVTYALLGALAGAFGESLQMAGLQQTVSIVSGILILLLLVLPAAIKGKSASILGTDKLMSWVRRKLGYYFQQNSLSALFMVGLLNGLLPCGFVYIALAGAISAPGVTGAMLYMALFGLGTFPLMFLVSLSGKLISLKVRGMFNRAVPYIGMTLAILFIVRGLGLGIPYLSPKVVETATHKTEMSCCTKPVAATTN
ncbi:sulfite exporter TauE/SafE family protein [Pontibacter sp. BT310]|uniref:Sulfite exporter TauE/SafE family protein n=1 Tax=Pontibacter populi TaxID=890055 RepID=A0ABS6XF48_9BACT|nr:MULTISPECIES: sulfite exporter TauE/SafE family protein [Pontibacter]MBJ6119769.1 sulfite exporter TauE/SafE family protein [Pontibacter sp. BT310]MBR0572198.1 sulfite exporter TauE/SafE family protein [Microvirga sp. STS03]MBW3366622.1 sulfite exporter TauE/SafE family protein [Pontibacter populi]